MEHRDWLTWFGFEYLSVSLSGCGRRIVVLDGAQTSDDLVRDVIEVLSSLCARLCGRRVGVAAGGEGGRGGRRERIAG